MRYALLFRHTSDEDIDIGVVEYEDSLENMHSLCSCDTIDIISLEYHIPQYQELFNNIVSYDEKIDIVIDDNGKMFNRPLTLPLWHNHRVYDIIVGDFIVIIGNQESGETYGFDEIQAEQLLTAFHLYTETFVSPLRYHFRHSIPNVFKAQNPTERSGGLLMEGVQKSGQ